MATSYLPKKIVSFIIINLLIETGFCQTNTTFGLTAGSGLPDLYLRYTVPNWTLKGLTLLKPLNLGIYGQYSISKQFKTGLDLTYYRLPLHASDGLGHTVFQETFTYLNIAPYVAYEPVKWVSVAYTLSVRPLLNYAPKEFSPSTALLSYHGPRLTIKPTKQLGVDVGYETGNRAFAIADRVYYPAFMLNSMVYANIRFVFFAK